MLFDHSIVPASCTGAFSSLHSLAIDSRGRLLPVRIDHVELPVILRSTQAIDATHRDPRRAATEILAAIGDLSKISPDDPRRAHVGRNLVFTPQEITRRRVIR